MAIIWLISRILNFEICHRKLCVTLTVISHCLFITTTNDYILFVLFSAQLVLVLLNIGYFNLSETLPTVPYTQDGSEQLVFFTSNMVSITGRVFLALAGLGVSLASLYPVVPVMKTVWTAGSTEQIAWVDDNQMPHLSQLGLMDIKLFVGNHVRQGLR